MTKPHLHMHKVAWLFMLLWLLAGSVAMAQQQVASLDFHWLHKKKAAERLFEQQQYVKATEALREAASEAPDEAQRVSLLAMAAIAQAHMGQVEEAIAQANVISDKDYASFAVLSIHSVQNDSKFIVENFARVLIERWPQAIRARGFHLRGQAYEAQKKLQEAIADYELCINAAGDQTELSLPVMMDIAELHSKQSQDEQAKATYQRLIELFGNPPEHLRGGHNVYPIAISRLAAMLATEKKFAQAIDCIERYPSKWSTSRSFGILLQRGDLYRDWGKPDQALAAYRDAVEFVKTHESHPRAPATLQKLTQNIKALETQHP